MYATLTLFVSLMM